MIHSQQPQAQCPPSWQQQVWFGLARHYTVVLLPLLLLLAPQDLPNYAQTQIPIFSLPQEWLWCESWCGNKTKSKVRMRV